MAKTLSGRCRAACWAPGQSVSRLASGGTCGSRVRERNRRDAEPERQSQAPVLKGGWSFGQAHLSSRWFPSRARGASDRRSDIECSRGATAVGALPRPEPRGRATPVGSFLSSVPHRRSTRATGNSSASTGFPSSSTSRGRRPRTWCHGHGPWPCGGHQLRRRRCYSLPDCAQCSGRQQALEMNDG